MWHSADRPSLLPSPCFGEQPKWYLDHEALASQIRKVEEENHLLRLQLIQSQAQEGTDNNQQGSSFVEDQDVLGDSRSNRTGCLKQRMVQKCEVKMKLFSLLRYL